MTWLRTRSSPRSLPVRRPTAGSGAAIASSPLKRRRAMATDQSVPRRVRFFTAGMAVAFIGVGVAKLFGLSWQTDFFSELGLPRALVPLVGAVELVVGLLCFNRR